VTLQVSPIVGLLPTSWREALLSKQLYSKVSTALSIPTPSSRHNQQSALNFFHYPPDSSASRHQKQGAAAVLIICRLLLDCSLAINAAKEVWSMRPQCIFASQVSQASANRNAQSNEHISPDLNGFAAVTEGLVIQ
jgi:hypothetical protein